MSKQQTCCSVVCDATTSSDTSLLTCSFPTRTHPGAEH
jgi:hypothetical protein